MSTTVQMRRKGAITLPIELRKRYGLNEGDAFTLQDLGDGSFLLLPLVSRVASLGDRVAEVMKDEEIGTEEMLETLEEKRENYYREHCV